MITLFWLIVLAVVGAIIICKLNDRYHWNGGKCPRCGHPWNYKDNLVSGQILCRCENCNNSVVIDKSVISKEDKKDD